MSSLSGYLLLKTQTTHFLHRLHSLSSSAHFLWSSHWWKPLTAHFLSSGTLWMKILDKHILFYWNILVSDAVESCSGKDLIQKLNLDLIKQGIQAVKPSAVLSSPYQQSGWRWRRCWTYEVSESERCWSAACRASGPSSDPFPSAPETQQQQQQQQTDYIRAAGGNLTFIQATWAVTNVVPHDPNNFKDQREPERGWINHQLWESERFKTSRSVPETLQSLVCEQSTWRFVKLHAAKDTSLISTEL